MKNKQNHLLLGCLALLFVVGSAACIQAAEPALQLKLGVVSTKNGSAAVRARALANAIAAGTGVAVEVATYPAAQGEAAVYRDFSEGALDIALLPDWSMAARFPAYAMFSLPFLFGNEEKASYFFRGESLTALAEPLLSRGVHVMGWLRCEPPVFLSGKPLLEKADFSGLRFGGQANPVLEKGLQMLGAALQPMPDAELAKSLAAGLVDGVVAPLPVLAAGDFPESVNVVTTSEIYYPYMAICMSGSAVERFDESGLEEFVETVNDAVQVNFYAAQEKVSVAKSGLEAKGYQFDIADSESLRQDMTGLAREAVISSGNADIQKQIEQLSKPIMIQ